MSLPVQGQGQPELDDNEMMLQELGGVPPQDQAPSPEQDDPNEEMMAQALVMLLKQEIINVIPEATTDQIADIAQGMSSGDYGMVFQATEAAIKTRDKKKMENKVGVKLQFTSTSTERNSNSNGDWGMSESEAGDFLRSNLREAGY